MTDINKFLQNESRRQRAYLWGRYIVFNPVVISKVFGDGLQVIWFTTIDLRPKFWIARIDSKTDIEYEWDYSDVYNAIVDQFGKSDEEKLPYPALTNTMGTCWGLLKNFGNGKHL